MTTYFSYPEAALQRELKRTAEAMVAPGKGILAVDEDNAGIGKLLAAVGLANSENNRRRYRQLLFTTKNLSEHVSAVILYDETVQQVADDGVPFRTLLERQGIIMGVKVDRDAVPMFLTDEVTTQGLDDLANRCAEYKKLGCRFAKWRCPIKISGRTPSVQAVENAAEVLARYAAVCQSQGLVPIVEPDVLLDGDHDIVRCQKVTEVVLSTVYKKLNDHHVYLEGTVLKPNMVTPGRHSPRRCSPEDVARATVSTLRRTVPPAVAGIAFLSGGQTEEESTVNLNAINKLPGAPWPLTFSFGRALQTSAWATWAGKDQNVTAAQAQLLKRTKATIFPGIAFLSGGQTEEESTVNLNAINKLPGAPWPLTFSFGRALQTSAWATWAGKDQNVTAAQAQLLKRTKANGLASLGKYTGK